MHRSKAPTWGSSNAKSPVAASWAMTVDRITLEPASSGNVHRRHVFQFGISTCAAVLYVAIQAPASCRIQYVARGLDDQTLCPQLDIRGPAQVVRPQSTLRPPATHLGSVEPRETHTNRNGAFHRRRRGWIARLLDCVA